MMAIPATPHGTPGLISRLARLGAADAALLAEALVTLGLSSVAIRLAPFARVGRIASRPLGRQRRPRDHVSARIAWAVRACARRAPWRAVCFQQGLTAQLMLRRRGMDSTLYFGAANDKTEGLAAHVWVKLGEREVIGCDEAPGYAVLATFPPSPGRPGSSATPIEERGRFDSAGS